MSETKDVLILAIESSCDETAAAVVKKWKRSTVQCHFFTDCPAYIVWRCCAGDCIQKTYRKD